jgi:hypothetical protein
LFTRHLLVLGFENQITEEEKISGRELSWRVFKCMKTVFKSRLSFMKELKVDD